MDDKLKEIAKSFSKKKKSKKKKDSLEEVKEKYMQGMKRGDC